MTLDATRRQSLTRAACRALLVPGGYGRVAASMGAVPVIIPVSFTLFNRDILFTPCSGEGLSRAVANCVVAFETDHVGPDGSSLWDVHVTGLARTFIDDGGASLFRLSSEIITGWRVAKEVADPLSAL